MSGAQAGVGCGATIVADGRILLIKWRRAPEAGCWNPPGGKVGFLERIEDAIRRETLEETGLAIRRTRLLRLTEMLDQDGQHRVSPVWVAEVASGEARNLELDNAEAVARFPLPTPPAPLGQAAREAIAELSVRR